MRLLGIALIGATGVLAGCGQGDDASPTTVAQSTGTSTTTTAPTITVTPPVVTSPTTSPVTTSPITTTPITTAPVTPDCSTVTPSTPGIVDGCGNISAAAYREMAPNLGTDSGIAYRYGSSGACGVADGNKSLPTWSHPADKFASIQGGWGVTYELGGPQSLLYDNYYDNMGQAVFVADDPATHPGVTQLMTVAFGQNVFSTMPQIPWTYYGGGDPDPNIVEYAKTIALSKPIAAARCYGRFNWCAESLIAYPNGFIGAAGSYTARNLWGVTLPAGKVPSAIAVTSAGEFALVTVWDTVNLKGQVAVIALGGTGGYWGDWGYPGLMNLGNISFMKLLGFVDLPGMMAPTEISASGDMLVDYSPNGGWLCDAAPLPGTRCLTLAANLPLSDAANRASFLPGGTNEYAESRGGVAVVLSKTEKKALFLDLKPLFAKMRTMYFGDAASYAKTTDVGQADAQWPYAFSVAPDYAPTVITTMTFDSPPTAVRTSMMQLNLTYANLSGGSLTKAAQNSRAWIATLDGTLHFIDVAGYGRHAAAVPSDIKEVGTLKIGKNTTSLAYMKHDPTDNTGQTPWQLSGLIATSRGECRIDWLQLNDANTSASVIRSLQDSRLVDPIAAEDNDASGGESYVLSVADYGGKQISNYRFGKVQFGITLQPGASVQPGCPYPSGCPLPGTDAFEFGGAYTVKGKPFIFTEANTP